MCVCERIFLTFLRCFSLLFPSRKFHFVQINFRRVIKQCTRYTFAICKYEIINFCFPIYVYVCACMWAVCICCFLYCNAFNSFIFTSFFFFSSNWILLMVFFSWISYIFDAANQFIIIIKFHWIFGVRLVFVSNQN